MKTRIKIFGKTGSINIGGKLLLLDEPRVMGILNITEDSFYDGGRYPDEQGWLERVQAMVDEGVDIVDLGAQSSRPGAEEKGADAEWQLLQPAIESIRLHFPDLPLSVDTWHSAVVRRAVAAGADLINDISGGMFDKAMFETIAELQVPYVLMHTSGHPTVMQQRTNYKDVLKEVLYFLSERIGQLHRLGVNDVIIDPGFGFGKTLEQNYLLMNNLEHFAFAGLPLLVGISRKSMIYKLMDIEPGEALPGTIALNMLALQKGADILRVHDVKEAVQTIRVYKALRESRAE